MTDRDYNSLFIKAIEQVDERITKDRLFSLIDSENTPSYSPFAEFINKYKHLQPSGNFEKLCNAIKYKQYTYANGTKQEVTEYIEIFLKKWLLGIISSMHGTYSILILVLTGGQRAGKTKFFRNLLPDDLMSFYAESKLDEGKDSEILMTKKLIILDDEFGGKSKQDAKRLKELSSKQWFNLRRPFGRTSEDLRRLAVLCGTSNDEEIINDPTGNRRIIPVNVIDIDHEAIEEINKIDLFIEIYHEWVNDKEGFMLTKDDIEILNNCTSLNEQPSPEEEMILKYFIPATGLSGNCSFLTNTEIKAYIEEKHHTIRLNSYKLGLTLKKLGFEKQSKKINGIKKLVYNLEMIL
jgi:predicted P-loop ATPase